MGAHRSIVHSLDGSKRKALRGQISKCMRSHRNNITPRGESGGVEFNTNTLSLRPCPFSRFILKDGVLQSITIQTSRHTVWPSDLIVLENFMCADLRACLYIIVVSHRGCKPEAYFLYC